MKSYVVSVFYYSHTFHKLQSVPVDVVNADSLRKAVRLASYNRFAIRSEFLVDFSSFIEKETFVYVVVQSRLSPKYNKSIYTFRYLG